MVREELSVVRRDRDFFSALVHARPIGIRRESSRGIVCWTRNEGNEKHGHR